tara:strand:+ start:504 stop:776 length:273 start_codon:yes stop_codon:yes gene_type:complete
VEHFQGAIPTFKTPLGPHMPVQGAKHYGYNHRQQQQSYQVQKIGRQAPRHQLRLDHEFLRQVHHPATSDFCQWLDRVHQHQKKLQNPIWN